MLEENKIHLGDCLDLMPSIPSKSVDMILCDLPYGTTACEWDSIIDMARLWQEYERVIKDNGAIVLTANSHFVFTLHASNPKLYRYKWVWSKNMISGVLNVNIAPLISHEDVLVFYKSKPSYYPQKTFNSKYVGTVFNTTKYEGYGKTDQSYKKTSDGFLYPRDVIYFDCERGQHPTQKPVALFEYLIKTYSNEGELILDNCSGSGTTAIACMNTNRRFICIERDETYHKKSIERMNNHEPLFHLGAT